MTSDSLKLDNLLCFHLYAASRLVIREHQPMLDQLGITYPQFLVMMVLWETDKITVNEISHLLLLNTNTVTPLLKRMEVMGLLERQRSKEDERKVVVSLTEKGKELKAVVLRTPQGMVENLTSDNLCFEDLIELREKLNLMIGNLSRKNKLTEKELFE